MDDSTNIPLKRCPKCERFLPITFDFFFHNKTSRTGFTARCKDCMNTYQRENKERVKAYKKRYYETNKEVLAKEYEIYRKEHREQRIEYDAQRYQLNPDEFKARTRAYQQTPKGRAVDRAAHHKRNRQKKASDTAFTAQDVLNKVGQQNGCCFYCGDKFGTGRRAYHVDHVVPLSRGGSNGTENIVIACPTCNLRKHNKTLSEWIKHYDIVISSWN